MVAKILDLKQILNKNVQSIMPMDEQKEQFSKSLSKFILRLQNNPERDEEFQKDVFRDFLQKVLPNNFINTSGRIDMAVYNGMKSASKPGVIIEYKKITNTSEMMDTTHLNVKSFRELVSYYLKERLVNNNLEVKKGIVTNGYDFFILSSDQLEKHFIKNKHLVDNYKKYLDNQLSSSTTDFLYQEVIAPEIDKAIKKGIKIGHFNLNDYIVKNEHRLNKQKITQLYRFFSERQIARNNLNEFNDVN